MKSKLFDYFKHLLVIILDYGQFKREYSRLNLRVQQLIYLAVGVFFTEYVIPILIWAEGLNFILWYYTQRDGSLQERKKEMLEEVIP